MDTSSSAVRQALTISAASVEERKTYVCPNPVFIVGSPRSGTTVLAQSLGEHSLVWGFDETQFLWDLFGSGAANRNYRRADGDGSWLKKQGITRASFLEHLGFGINAMLTGLSGGLRWVDQTPIYALIADQVAEMFPGSRFVHICRDGRSAVHSMINYANRFTNGSAPSTPWSSSFREACRTWKRHVETALDFADANPERCVSVHNEELTKDPDCGFAEILAFLELPLEPGPAEFFRANRVNSSFDSVGPADGRPDADAIWRAWHPTRRSVFLEEVGATPARAGYPTPRMEP